MKMMFDSDLAETPIAALTLENAAELSVPPLTIGPHEHSRRGLLLAPVLILGLTSCSGASYDEKISYLRKAAQRGADTHSLLTSQEATIDKGRCTRAFAGNSVLSEAPGDMSSGGKTPAWQQQVEEFFVDSCISGKPKPVPGQAPASSTTPSSSTTTSPTTSPTPTTSK